MTYEKVVSKITNSCVRQAVVVIVVYVVVLLLSRGSVVGNVLAY